MGFPSPSEKQARVFWTSITALAVGVLVFLGLLLLWALGLILQVLAPVLLPLAIAGIVAYLLDPLVEFFEKRGVARARAILLVFFIGIASVAVLLGTIVPRLVYETGDLIDRAPAYSRQLCATVQGWMTDSPLVHKVNRFWGTTVPPSQEGRSTNAVVITERSPELRGESQVSEAVLTWFNKILPQLAEWAWTQLKRAAALAGLLLGFFLIPIYVFYLLLEKRKIQRQWSDYLPLRESRLKGEVIFVLSAINDCLIVFFRGQVLVALCSGVLLTTGFLLMGLNYAVLLGVMAGLLGIVPYLGTLVSLVPAVTLAAVQFHDWFHPGLVLMIFALVNLNESLVVSPKIIGNRVGLHPLAIIVAVMIGTTLLGGILGGMLAIPLTAALRAVMYRYIWQTRAARQTSP